MLEKELKRFLRHRLRRLLNGKQGTLIAILALIGLLILSYIIPDEIMQGPSAPTTIVKKGDQFFQCKVTKLTDGDSINAQCPHQNSMVDLRIRVYGIDAPEMRQKPWGEISKKFLHQLLDYDNLTVEVKDIDRYQRYVAKIYNGNQDLGLTMVESGMAVVYERYNDDPQYKVLENQAKKDKIGIWSQSGSQQNPEKWRRLN